MLHDGAWKRTCDRCGYNGPFKDLTPVGGGKYHCRDDRDGWTADQTRRHNRQRRPILIKPRPHARITGEVPLYQMDEAEVFYQVIKYSASFDGIGPTGALRIGATAAQVADRGIYLREMLLEDKRPLRWMTQALSALKSIGNSLRSLQFGGLGAPSEPTNSILYGSVADNFGSANTPLATAGAGLVFLALAQKDPTNIAWLAAADACAWFMRQIQRCDLLTANPVVDSNGNPVFVGGWPTSINRSSKVPTATFPTSYAWCLWFMKEYADVRGATTVLGTTTASGDFASAPSGTVQQTIDDAIAFYATGRLPYSSTSTGTCAPLSTATPQSLATPANAATFTNAASGSYLGISGEDFALALRGLYEAEGYSARVAGIFEWLMGFTSNAAFELADTSPLSLPLAVIAAGTKGTYDPAVGMAEFLALGTAQAQAPTLTTNGTSFYGTAATGILGPLYNASGRLLRTWKDEATKKRPLNGSAVDSRLPLLGSTVGLSFQLSYNQTANYSLSTMSRNGLIFRAAPGAFNPLRGLP